MIMTMTNSQRKYSRNYSDDNFRNALQAVLCGKMNPSQAARTFGVPRMTVVDNVAKLQRQIYKDTSIGNAYL